jgi:predicted kinase
VPVVAVLVGLQASGKTTFCQRMLGPGFVVVSKAHLRHARHPQRRQMHLIEEALSAGCDVVVDNTNPSPQEWAPLIDAARAHGARVVAYWFPPDLAGSLQRNAARPDGARIPELGLRATLARLLRPRVQDDFDEVFAVEFHGSGGFIVRPAGEESDGGEPACSETNSPTGREAPGSPQA